MEISIRGQVRSHNGSPISMIKVSVYRGDEFIAKEYSNDAGHYAISLAAGEPVTVRFDTHWSLTNAKEWHPSVVANLDAGKDILLDRSLVKVGTSGGEMADVDALTAYEFITVWIADEAEPYRKYAADRLSQLKMPNYVLSEVQRTLLSSFESMQ